MSLTLFKGHFISNGCLPMYFCSAVYCCKSMNSFLNLEESNIVNVSINEIPPAPDCLPEDIDIIESGNNYSVIKGVRSNARLYLFDNFLYLKGTVRKKKIHFPLIPFLSARSKEVDLGRQEGKSERSKSVDIMYCRHRN